MKSISNILSMSVLLVAKNAVAMAESPPDLFWQERDALDRAKILWDSQGIDNYEFEYYKLSGTGNDPANTVYPWRVKVQDGQETTAIDGNKQNVPGAYPPDMDKLFATIERQLDRDNVLELVARYNIQYGYPESILMDMEDGGLYHVEVSNFAVIGTQNKNQVAPSKLEQAVDANLRWRSHNIQSYSYQYTEYSMGQYYEFPLSVTVHGRQVTMHDRRGNQIQPWHPQFMEGFFERIRTALDRKAPYVEVTYNADYGFPEDIYIVDNDEVAVLTFDVRISSFLVL
ncbi:expressed unknown protein [Seminavis robusta]|uniref:Uncharacterized protein n=1 Tax=Seminavis robusta TaxID=568900 RepID=A0A9N8DQT1_9STRA|nr:expressed unknown protein [Seminavis robusta]|eukprot:Sro286_g108300.1 n/a (285) ;mRNA; r:35954-36808